MLVALVGPLSLSALAQNKQSSERQLEEIQREIEQGQVRSQALTKEAERAAKDARDLRRRLVTTAARVQEKESAVTLAETNLQDLAKREAELTSQFEERRTALVETLAALQRIQTNPPPALIIHPDDAADAARSAILLADIAPGLKAQADALADELDELRSLRLSILAERTRLGAADEDLSQERERLAKLLDSRERKYRKLIGQANSERDRLDKLALEAESLTDLLASLTYTGKKAIPRRKPGQQTEPKKTQGGIPIPRRSPLKANTEDFLVASIPSRSNNSRIAKVFSAAKGQIRLPATGKVRTPFGQADAALGSRTEGISLVTRSNAQVVAPFDGEIVFAGPYRGYGQLLIIAVGEGYHLVLSGMETLNGVVGQRLLAGEPIGMMMASGDHNRQTSSQADRVFVNQLQVAPVLYIEFRKDGKPFDPMPWLAASGRKGSG